MSVTTSDTKILQKSCGQLRNSVSLTKMHLLSLTGVPAQSGVKLYARNSPEPRACMPYYTCGNQIPRKFNLLYARD